jgi:hypothetical protein
MLSDNEMEEIKDRHYQLTSTGPNDSWCPGCHSDWPCDAIKLLQHMEELEKTQHHTQLPMTKG